MNYLIMKINRVVVTGATGMIAVALIKRLIQDNINVYAVTRPDSRNQSRLPKSDLINIIECDLSEISGITKNITTKIDVFYHFGWEASANNRDSDIDAQILNIKYTLDAYRAACTLGSEKFIGAGSQAEYGVNVDDLIIDEESPLNPTSPYGIAKTAAYKIIHSLSYGRNTGVIWARVFSVYGTNDHEHTLINKLINAQEGSVIDISSCEQTWNYLYEEDAGEAFYKLGVSGRVNEVYNIANGESKQLKLFVNQVFLLLNRKLILNFGAINNLVINNLNPSIKKLENDTGFFSKISFQEGIAKIIENRKCKNE